MPKRKGIPITVRALVQRINRALAKEDQKVRSTRGRNGAYYLINAERNVVITEPGHLDLEALGRELGVLDRFEYVVDGEAL